MLAGGGGARGLGLYVIVLCLVYTLPKTIWSWKYILCIMIFENQKFILVSVTVVYMKKI